MYRMMQWTTAVWVLTCWSTMVVGADREGKKKGSLEVAMTADELDRWAKENGLQTATLGTGCFWCTEACLEQLKGVEKVVSGYSGGHVDNPTYEQVCGKKTGHAEVVQVYYDPKQLTFDQLLEKFWFIHDPTTKDRQGNDVGPQYRSVIFYHDEEQREKAVHYMKRLEDEKVYDRPIVTEITAFTKFWPAELYHQNYFKLNPGNPYCQAIVGTKLAKFKKAFKADLKSEP